MYFRLFMGVPSKTTRIALWVILLIAQVTLHSCKKISSGKSGSSRSDSGIPDLTTTVTTSVSGFITDYSGTPLSGAQVSFGNGTAVADQFGYFEINNVSAVQDAAVVTAVMPGYYMGIKTFEASSHHSEFIRMILITTGTHSGTIDALQGGTFTSSDGGWEFTLMIPPNAVINAATNNPYNGSIYISAEWIPPQDPFLYYLAPGDLRGLDSAGIERLLSVHAIEFLEIKGGSGETLKLAPGKNATVTSYFSSGSSGGEPPTIPLWSFDPTLGLWKEEGVAANSGASFSGETKDLSFLCFAQPLNFVHITGTIISPSGIPLPYEAVNVISTPSDLNDLTTFSDSTGYFSGIIPASSSIGVIIPGVATSASGNSAFFKQVVVGSTDISLGNVMIPLQYVSSATGTITSCSGNMVKDGDVIMKESRYNAFGWYHFSAPGTGSFAVNFIYTNPPATFDSLLFLSEEKSTGETGNPVVIIPDPGSNNLGNLSTCGTSGQVNFSFTLLTSSGAPVPQIWASVVNVSNPADTLWFLTDSSGYAHGRLSENSNFIVNIAGSRTCGNSLYSKSFSTSMSNLSLGDINVSGLSMATMTGTVTDCNGSTVTSGYLLVDKDSYRINVPLTTSGTFSFTTIVCNTVDSEIVSIIPVDAITQQAGYAVTIPIKAGNNSTGALPACVTADVTGQYINYSVDGTNYSYTSPPDTILQTSDFNTYITNIGASANLPYWEVGMIFYNNGIGIGSSQDLDGFSCPQLQSSIIPPINVSITEYDPVGGYIAGYFTGKVEKSSTDTSAYTVHCTFRVKRYQ
jgi:hypothetical protein